MKKKLPDRWKWTSLGDDSFVTLIMGQSPPGNTYNKNRYGLPFFQGKADFGNIYPEPSVWCSEPIRIAEPNDILLSVRAPVGPTNIAKEKCCIGRGLAAIRCKDELSYKYLIWILRHFEQQISLEGVGSTFNAIGKDDIKAIKFPLPLTIDDQIIIANEIESKMAEIEKIRQSALRQKEAITAMQGAILRQAFRWKEDDRLPAGWRLKSLGEVCLINPVKRRNLLKEANDLTSFVPMEVVNELTGRISQRITRPFSEISKGYTFFEDGDILFAKITPCMENGKSAIAENLIGGFGFGSTEFHVLRAGPETIKEWIYYFVRTKEFRREAEKSFRAGAGQKRVPTDFIEKELMPLPPTLDDQISITNELKCKIDEIENMSKAVDKELEAIEVLSGAILREVFDFDRS